MIESKILFKNGPLSVSTTMLRFRGRRYKLNHIENLILKRPLFLMGLGFGAFLALFAIINADLLYAREAITTWIAVAVLPAISWPFGTLTMHSRTLSTNEGSITWLHRDLAKAQDAVEDVLAARSDSIDQNSVGINSSQFPSVES